MFCPRDVIFFGRINSPEQIGRFCRKFWTRYIGVDVKSIASRLKMTFETVFFFRKINVEYEFKNGKNEYSKGKMSKRVKKNVSTKI